MADLVVTVPMGLWSAWLKEGDLPGQHWTGKDSHFWIPKQPMPTILPYERVYIVAHGRLRGYSPLVGIERSCRMDPSRSCLLRRSAAVAMTIDEPIPGFRGFRYRWWNLDDEKPFPGWKTEGVRVNGAKVQRRRYGDAQGRQGQVVGGHRRLAERRPAV